MRCHCVSTTCDCWDTVSGDQFGEQTAFVFGKRALNGMDLSDELECEWIVKVNVSDHVEHITVMIDQFSLLRHSAGGSEAPVYL